MIATRRKFHSFAMVRKVRSIWLWSSLACDESALLNSLSKAMALPVGPELQAGRICVEEIPEWA
jgi:hypothetical protein